MEKTGVTLTSFRGNARKIMLASWPNNSTKKTKIFSQLSDTTIDHNIVDFSAAYSLIVFIIEKLHLIQREQRERKNRKTVLILTTAENVRKKFKVPSRFSPSLLVSSWTTHEEWCAQQHLRYWKGKFLWYSTK